MQLLHSTLPKLKLVLVLIGRWSPKACGELSQRADAGMVGLFVNGPAVLAIVQGESELGQHLHDSCRTREGVGIRLGGLIFDGGDVNFTPR